MHHHTCQQETTNGQKCGQIVQVSDGSSCPECGQDHRCSLHTPDPEHRIEPTPPLKK